MLHKLASFIVKKRHFILIPVLIIAGLCCFTVNKVNINYDLTEYLGRETETRKSLELMQREFGSTETLSLMLKNAPTGAAENLKSELSEHEGIIAANFDGINDVRIKDGDRYECLTILLDNIDAIEFYESLDRELALRSDIGEYVFSGSAPQTVKIENKIAEEVPIAMLIAVIVVLAVLLLTSHSYIEPLVFMLVLVVSILINMGTNFIFGTISFITFAVCAILQLALAMDYSIMLLHTYFDIRDNEPDDEKALILALERTMMPISSSALTTVSGLVSLMFMSFTIGYDIGIVLSKGILITMLCVFTFMPALIMLFSKPLNRLRHKPIRLGGRKLGAFAAHKLTRIIVPVILVSMVVLSAIMVQKVEFTFTDQNSNTDSDPVSQVFGVNNTVAVILPSDGSEEAYAKQSEFVQSVEALTFNGAPAIKSVNSIVTTGEAAIKRYTSDEAYDMINSFMTDGNELAITEEAFDGFLKNSGYPEGITASELIDMVSDMGLLLSRLGMMNEGQISEISGLREQIALAKSMFVSDDYVRLIISLNTPIKGEESEKILAEIISLMKRMYPGEETGITGLLMSMYDISHAFNADMTRVSLITVIAIFIIIMISFRNLLIPILLICAIQGAVWINFALSVPAHIEVFFMCYLICLAIQMGATIDYGILLTSNYVRSRSRLSKTEALKEAMHQSLPTIITSGLILFGAGFTIGKVCSVYYIYSIGLLISSGAVFSLIMVLLLLPTLLINCDRLIVRRDKKLVTGEQNV